MSEATRAEAVRRAVGTRGRSRGEVRASYLDISTAAAVANSSDPLRPPSVQRVVFAPLITTAIRSPSSGVNLRARTAAHAAAPPGSTTIRSVDHSASCALRISSSVTRMTRATSRLAIGKLRSPMRRGARESAAMLPAGASTGRPLSSAFVKVGAPSGSTPITRTFVPANQRARPEINPPPPTAAMTVVMSGACSSSSSPRVPCPRIVISASKAWTDSAPLEVSHVSHAASASP